MNGPAAVLVELAEKLVATVAHADWAMFQKNGGGATTSSVTIARAGTGRRTILAPPGPYHLAIGVYRLDALERLSVIWRGVAQSDGQITLP